MAETKKTVVVEFVSKGLDQIQKQVEAAIPFLTKKSGKEASSSLLNEIQSIARTISETTKWSAEGINQLYKSFSGLITRMGGLKTELFKFTSEESKKEFERLREHTDALETRIRNAESELRGSQRNVWKENNTIITSKKFKEDIFADFGTGALSSAGKSTQNLETFNKAVLPLEQAFVKADLNAEQLSQDNALLEQQRSIIEKILADTKSKLTVEQAIEQVRIKQNVESIISQSAENELNINQKHMQEEILALKKEQNDTSQKAAEILNQSTVSDEASKNVIEQTNAVTKTSIELKEGLNRTYEEYTDEIEAANRATEEEKRRLKETNKEQEKAEKAIKKTTQAHVENNTTIGAAAKNVFSYGTAYMVLRRVYRETIKTITELDKALTNMAIVTDMDRKAAWKLVPQMQELANKTGFTTTEISALTTEYLRQGRTLNDAITLTEAAAKAAKIAGISAGDSVKYLTAAINGFSLAADQAMEVSDKFAALAAASATNYEQLAVGLSKFASQANLAGLSMDFALGMLAKGIETTQEAPESIGTALKTVLARMRELTDYGKTLEDGMNVNRVETALEQVGVKLRDVNGSFRSMEEVLTEVGKKWNTLNTDQQAAVAVAMAGTRQQSRLISMFQDFDRTLELVTESEESSGATMVQHMEYMKSMEAAMTALRTAWQGFITTITDSEVIIGIVKGITGALNALNDVMNFIGVSGKNAMIIIVGLLLATKANSIAIALSTKAEQLGLITKGKTIASEKRLILLRAIGTKQIDALTAGIIEYNAISTIQNAIEDKKIALMVSKEVMQTIAISKEHGLSIAMTQSAIAEKIKTLAIDDEIKSILLKNIATSIETGLIKENTSSQIVNTATIFSSIYADKTKAFWDKVTAIRTAIKTKLTWANTKAMLANAAATMLALLPYILIAAAIAVVIVGFIALGKSIHKSNQSLEEHRKALDAANYELNKTNKSMQDLIDKYDELSSKSIQTDEDIEALKNLEEELDRLQEGKYLAKDGGVINWDETMISLNDAIEKNKATMVSNLSNIFSKAIKEAFKDDKTWDSAELKAGADFMMAKFTMESGEEISKENRSALQNYLATWIGEQNFQFDKNTSEKELNAWYELNSGIVREAINDINNWKIEMEKANSVLDQYGIFKRLMSEAETETEAAVIDGLSRQYPLLAKIYSDFSDSVNKSGFFETIEKIGGTAEAFTKFELEARTAGYDADKLLSAIAKRTEEIITTGIPAADAASQAYMELALAEENATFKAILMQKAMGKSALSLAQSLDQTKSILKNVNETQAKFIKGELTNEDFFNFVEEHRDLFSNEEFVDAFENGLDTSIFMVEEVLKSEAELRTQLRNYYMLLANGDESDSVKAEIARLELLLKYNGILKGLTQSQINYNNLLAQANRLEELGIDKPEIRQKALDAMAITTAQTISEAEQKMNNLTDEYIEKLGMNEKELSNIVQEVNGVMIISNAKLYNELTSEQQTYLDSYINASNLALDEITKAFTSYRDAQIKQQEEFIDEQIGIYEEYFDKIDRLEKKQVEEKDRNNILAQLQRLEGATDERSRQKAKELRQQLNELDTESKENEREQARQDLIDNLKLQKEELTTIWGEIADKMVIAMKDGGKGAALQYIAGLEAAGVLTKTQANAARTALGESNVIEERDFNNATNNDPEWIQQAENWAQASLSSSTIDKYNDMISAINEYMFRNNYAKVQGVTRQQLANFLAENGFDENTPINWINNSLKQAGLIRNFISLRSRVKWDELGHGFRKGGLVSYTGPAMVHGTQSSPEAFLNARQTALFADLRDILQNSAAKSTISSTPVVVENITIQTAQLNNNQDFKSAGNALAEAFSTAINRRGLNLNVKR